MRVLITGMSGAGKSSVVVELRRRGHVAYDVDEGLTYLDPADGRWHWDIARVRDLLRRASPPVFLAGCSEEQALLSWDKRVLLTAPTDVLLQRIDSRPSGLGKAPHERALVLSNLAQVEPLLRRSADLLMDATRPLHEVVAAVLASLQSAGDAGCRSERLAAHSR